MKYLLAVCCWGLCAFGLSSNTSKAQTLEFVNLYTNNMVVDNSGYHLVFPLGVTRIDLSALGADGVNALSTAFDDDVRFSGVYVTPYNDVSILFSGGYLQGWHHDDMTTKQRFLAGFSFIFLIGLTVMAARWVKMIIGGGTEESE